MVVLLRDGDESLRHLLKVLLSFLLWIVLFSRLRWREQIRRRRENKRYRSLSENGRRSLTTEEVRPGRAAEMRVRQRLKKNMV